MIDAADVQALLNRLTNLADSSPTFSQPSGDAAWDHAYACGWSHGIREAVERTRDALQVPASRAGSAIDNDYPQNRPQEPR